MNCDAQQLSSELITISQPEVTRVRGKHCFDQLHDDWTRALLKIFFFFFYMHTRHCPFIVCHRLSCTQGQSCARACPSHLRAGRGPMDKSPLCHMATRDIVKHKYKIRCTSHTKCEIDTTMPLLFSICQQWSQSELPHLDSNLKQRLNHLILVYFYTYPKTCPGQTQMLGVEWLFFLFPFEWLFSERPFRGQRTNRQRHCSACLLTDLIRLMTKKNLLSGESHPPFSNFVKIRLFHTVLLFHKKSPAMWELIRQWFMVNHWEKKLHETHAYLCILLHPWSHSLMQWHCNNSTTHFFPGHFGLRG